MAACSSSCDFAIPQRLTILLLVLSFSSIIITDVAAADISPEELVEAAVVTWPSSTPSALGDQLMPSMASQTLQSPSLFVQTQPASPKLAKPGDQKPQLPELSPKDMKELIDDSAKNVANSVAKKEYIKVQRNNAEMKLEESKQVTAKLAQQKYQTRLELTKHEQKIQEILKQGQEAESAQRLKQLEVLQKAEVQKKKLEVEKAKFQTQKKLAMLAEKAREKKEEQHRQAANEALRKKLRQKQDKEIAIEKKKAQAEKHKAEAVNDQVADVMRRVAQNSQELKGWKHDVRKAVHKKVYGAAAPSNLLTSAIQPGLGSGATQLQPLRAPSTGSTADLAGSIISELSRAKARYEQRMLLIDQREKQLERQQPREHRGSAFKGVVLPRHRAHEAASAATSELDSVNLELVQLPPETTNVVAKVQIQGLSMDRYRQDNTARGAIVAGIASAAGVPASAVSIPRVFKSDKRGSTALLVECEVLLDAGTTASQVASVHAKLQDAGALQRHIMKAKSNEMEKARAVEVARELAAADLAMAAADDVITKASPRQAIRRDAWAQTRTTAAAEAVTPEAVTPEAVVLRHVPEAVERVLRRARGDLSVGRLLQKANGELQAAESLGSEAQAELKSAREQVGLAPPSAAPASSSPPSGAVDIDLLASRSSGPEVDRSALDLDKHQVSSAMLEKYLPLPSELHGGAVVRERPDGRVEVVQMRH